MSGRSLLGSGKPVLGGNIYADKSSIVLDWLLRVGIVERIPELQKINRKR
jgi:hypothetical protein